MKFKRQKDWNLHFCRKAASPCSKKTSYQAKLKQHPIDILRPALVLTVNSHCEFIMDSCILKPFPIEEWIHDFYWEKLPIDTITHKGIFFFFSFSFCANSIGIWKKSGKGYQVSTQTKISSNKPQSRQRFFTWKTLQWEGKNHRT